MVSSAQGRDVSNFQGPVDWDTLSGGLSFAFAKATEGLTYRDPYFAANWKAMAAHGLHRGAYHFFHPALDPVKQADFFTSVAGNQGLVAGDMMSPDVEITSGHPRARLLARQNVTAVIPSGMRTATVAQAAKAFADEVSRLIGPGHPVPVYTNKNVGDTLTGCGAYPLWIAWPTAGPPPVPAPWAGKGWKLWQWGTAGGVDADAYNGTPADMAAWLASYAPQPAPKPVTQPEEDPMQIPQSDKFAYIKFEGGQYKWIALDADPGVQGKQPQQIRLAIKSGPGAWQIVQTTVPDTKGGTVTVGFASPSVNGVSVKRLDDQANWVPVGYNLG